MSREYVRETRVLGNVKQFGNILLFDSGEDGMLWTNSGDVAEPKCIISDNRSLNYGAMLEIYNNSETIADNKYIVINKQFNAAPTKMYFVTAIYKVMAKANVDNYEFALMVRSNDKWYAVKIKHDLVNSRLKYLNSAGSYVNVVDSDITVNNGSWNYIKFSFNTKTDNFGKLVFNDTEYDLSDIEVNKSVSVGASYGRVDITIYQEGADANFKFCLDSIMITGDK